MSHGESHSLPISFDEGLSGALSPERFAIASFADTLAAAALAITSKVSLFNGDVARGERCMDLGRRPEPGVPVRLVQGSFPSA